MSESRFVRDSETVNKNVNGDVAQWLESEFKSEDFGFDPLAMLDTRLTWKPHIEAVVQARVIKKLSLMKKLAGTTELGRKLGHLAAGLHRCYKACH